MNTAADSQAKALDIYEKWNRWTADNYRQNANSLDNKLLTLSAGTLGLSLTFVGNLVNLASASLLPVLVASWVLLTLSSLAGLFGLRFATKESTVREMLDAAKQKGGLGAYQESGPDVAAGKVRSDAIAKRIELYNLLAFWVFVFGLTAMITFISVNILRVQ